LDFLDQWDPKSPWHDRRVRLAASPAKDRKAINQAEMLGLGKEAGSFVLTSWREKKLKGPHRCYGRRGQRGRAQAKELDRKKRETLLH